MTLPLIVTAKIGETATGFLTSVTRAVHYSGNEALPNLRPNADQVIDAWDRNFISERRMRDILKVHGMDMRPIDISVYTYAERFHQNMPADLNPDYVHKELTEWESILRSRIYVPTIDECNALLNREVITPRLHEYLMNRNVGKNHVMAHIWEKMRFEIPGPADLIRFAVRDAYFPDLVELFGYHHEVPTQVLPWMSKQGYGGPTGIQIPRGGSDYLNQPREGEATWFDHFWWAHWTLPSVGQGYEMLHRLYPDSVRGHSRIVNDQTAFTQDTLEKLMRGSDIPDYWRKRLTAISFHPIDKTDGEYCFENGLINENDYFHIVRAHGYNDEDAELLVKMSSLKKQRNLKIDPGQQSLDYVCQYYKLGVINDNDATVMLQKNGYSNDDTIAFLGKCRLEVKGETVKELQSTLKQAFYHGIFSKEELRLELLRNGLNPTVTDYWIQRWDYNRLLKWKPASARQNLQAFKSGVMNEAILVTRLFNLGYDGASISVMVGNAKAQIMQAQSAFLEKQRRNLARQQKAAQEESLKEKKRALKKDRDDAKIVTNKANKRLRNFIKVSSDKNIKDWFKDQLITLWEVYYRLYYKGYTIADAERWVEANFKDTTKENRNAATTQAQKQFRSEGNYLE